MIPNVLNKLFFYFYFFHIVNSQKLFDKKETLDVLNLLNCAQHNVKKKRPRLRM